MGVIMPIAAWLRTAWMWIRLLPIAKMIKPLWKSGLKALILREGDVLEAQIEQGLRDKSPDAINSLFDRWENGVKSAVLLVPIPDSFKSPILQAILEESKTLRSEASKAALSGSGAIKAIFLESEQVLCAKIDAQ